jgi:hypothetical protein
VLRILRRDAPVTEVTLEHLAEHSASCRITGDAADVHPGDEAVVIRQGPATATADSVAVPATAPVSATATGPARAMPAERDRPFFLRGRLTLQWLHSNDRSEADLDLAQPSLRFDLRSRETRGRPGCRCAAPAPEPPRRGFSPRPRTNGANRLPRHPRASARAGTTAWPDRRRAVSGFSQLTGSASGRLRRVAMGVRGSRPTRARASRTATSARRAASWPGPTRTASTVPGTSCWRRSANTTAASPAASTSCWTATSGATAPCACTPAPNSKSTGTGGTRRRAGASP